MLLNILCVVTIRSFPNLYIYAIFYSIVWERYFNVYIWWIRSEFLCRTRSKIMLAIYLCNVQEKTSLKSNTTSDSIIFVLDLTRRFSTAIIHPNLHIPRIINCDWQSMSQYNNASLTMVLIVTVFLIVQYRNAKSCIIRNNNGASI